MAGKKTASPVDVHVGARVRMRRLMLEMSQEKLAGGLSLTFQQVQKYEKGSNRIGASRLQQIAGILQVPPDFFFEGAPRIGEKMHADAPSSTYVREFVSTTDGLALMGAFTRIKNAQLRRCIVRLVEAISQD